MALSKRIIPCLDVDAGNVVKGINFSDVKIAGDPVFFAKKYTQEGADEIVFLDINASHEGREALKTVIEEVARVINIPFTVGGGIRNLHDAREILLSGADKVSINTAAVKNPELVSQLMNLFGKQCVVVAIDVKRHYVGHSTGKKSYWFEVRIFGGREGTGIEAIEWTKKVEKLGAGEILLTSIDKDGTENGYDLELIRAISRAVRIPVIASGGCGSREHILEVFRKADVEAALAASIFHYEKATITSVKQYLKENGVNVRM
jgi:imidazole glycerol-phosphate synthase subunit HisF